MNSEELELSLRSEFENYLKTLVSEMKSDVSEFQNKIEAEFEKHKSQFDEALKEFAARFDAEREFDVPFRESVTEHLRLARDEGAKISATAFAEAQELEEANAAPAPLNEIRDAVNDISSKDSQSSILKSLVHQASKFAARGAFFIIKNEHFVGWKVFGNESEGAEQAVREIHFPTSADSVLGEAVSSMSTVESSSGKHSDDTAFLDELHFGKPDRMYAIPLVARGRGVAVMYADYGTEGVNVNVEALETLVRVAGLTVELLASTQQAKAEQRTMGAADFEDAQHDHEAAETPVAETAYDAPAAEAHYESPAAETAYDSPVATNPYAEEPPDFAFSDSVSMPGGFQQESDFDAAPEYEMKAADEFERHEAVVEEPQFETSEVADQAHEFVPAAEDHTEEPEPEIERHDGAMVFESGGSIEPAVPESSPFDRAAESYEPATVGAGADHNFVVEPVATVPQPAAAGSRLSDRHVDLPIDVPDEERRLHNDARRFARLLVSEIKLYNEKKVLEGREAGDLYERLKEAIDRSREMYDKRVQPPVAAKFDYFHYELLNSLAEGNESQLGPGYPGSSV